MTLLKPAPVSTANFSYDAENQIFTAFMSDLPGVGLGRVYDDACDDGMTLVSSRTGRAVVFVVEHVDRDPEGDIRYWSLCAVDLRDPWRVQVFND